MKASSLLSMALCASALGRRAARQWHSSSLTRAIGTLAGGSALAQALALVTAPIITRLYSPADFGVAALLNSTVTVLLILATFRYELAMTLPRDEHQTEGVLLACLLLACFSGLLAGVLAWTGGRCVLAWVGAPGLYKFWWMIPTSVFAGAVYQSLSAYRLRRKEYRVLARTRLGQSFGGALSALGLGLFSEGPLGLLLSWLISSSFGISRLGHGVVRPAFAQGATVLTRRVYQALATYGRCATFGVGAALLNATGTVLAPFLFAAFYGQETVGAMSLAQRVILLPMTLVGTAVAQVFLAEASEMVRERAADLPPLLEAMTRKLAVLSLGILAIGAVSPWVFPAVFGAPWRLAGVFAACLSLSCAGQFVVSPISNISVLMRRQEVQFALDALRTVAVLLAIWLPAHYRRSAIVAMACYTSAMFAIYAVSYIAYRRLGNSCARGSGGLHPL